MLTSDDEYELVAIYFLKKHWRFKSALKWMKKNSEYTGLIISTSDGWMFSMRHGLISNKCVAAKIAFGIEGIYDVQNFEDDNI